MNSPHKRKGISSKAETEKTKQKRVHHKNDLLSKYFLEEDFKIKFGAAFRFVKQLWISQFPAAPVLGHLSCQMPNSGDESGGQMPRPRDHGSFHTTGFIYYIIHSCRFQRFNTSSHFLTAEIDRSELYSKDFADKYCILYYYFSYLSCLKLLISNNRMPLIDCNKAVSTVFFHTIRKWGKLVVF